MTVTVKGLENIFQDLKAAAPNPYLLSDILWILGKSLKDKISRQLLIQKFTLPVIVRELLGHIMYFSKYFRLKSDMLEIACISLKSLYIL